MPSQAINHKRLLRSKKIIVREAQKSESSPKEKQAESIEAGARGPRKNKKGPRGLKPRRRNVKKKKEIHDKRLSSQDPQQPSRGADPSRHTVKRRLGQLERKGQKKKIRNRAKNTSAKRPSNLSWHK